MEKQIIKEPNSVQMIDARTAILSYYSYPITKSSNWTAVMNESITSEHFVVDLRLLDLIVKHSCPHSPFRFSQPAKRSEKGYGVENDSKRVDNLVPRSHSVIC